MAPEAEQGQELIGAGRVERFQGRKEDGNGGLGGRQGGGRLFRRRGSCKTGQDFVEILNGAFRVIAGRLNTQLAKPVEAFGALLR